jgi:hypothetical protein
MTGVLTWLVRWACRAGTRDFCSALAALVGPVQNISVSLDLDVPVPWTCGLSYSWVS